MKMVWLQMHLSSTILITKVLIHAQRNVSCITNAAT